MYATRVLLASFEGQLFTLLLNYMYARNSIKLKGFNFFAKLKVFQHNRNEEKNIEYIHICLC